MGLFDKLNSLLGVTVSKQPQETQTIDRRTIMPAQIGDMQKIPASDRYRDKIHRKYYSSYPVKPFISLDRERNTNWLEQAELFPKQSIIPVSMMTPFSDGLLPGHIYLLYWIGKNGQKKAPSYFEYKYGIEFEKEKQFLISNGYLADNKPTSKGADVIVAHFDIIEAHSPEATSAKKAQKQFAGKLAAYFGCTELPVYRYDDNLSVKYDDYHFYKFSPLKMNNDLGFLLFSILCSINYVIEFIENYFTEEIPQKFKFAYLQYYYLCDFIIDLNDKNGINFDLDTRLYDRNFRNCLAHYGLGQYISENEIIANDTLKGLTVKAFGKDYYTAKAELYSI